MSGLDDLLAALDEHSGSVVTSVRQPASLRRALTAAVRLGLVSSANEAQTVGLRTYLETLARRAALDAHYARHPETRPTLAEVALALAELDHSDLAEHPELIERAAAEVVGYRPDADADDVLLWAAAISRGRPARRRSA